ncbi:MAG: MFS transporter [Elusimicrobiota bacterium]|jgi:predicted MFS family arabinose efflux permease
MVLVNAAKYVHRQAPYGLLPLIQSDLALTDLQAGLTASAFMAAYILAALPLGWLASRGCRQAWIAWPFGISSLAVAGAGLCSGLGGFVASRAAAGACQAGFGSAAPSFIAEHHPGRIRPLALALYSAAIPLGSALGYVLSGRFGSLWGWRTSLAVLGLPGVVLAVAARFLPSPVGTVPAPTLPGTSAEGRRGSAMPALKTYLALLRIPSYSACTFAMALATFAIGGFGVWMPTFFTRRGFGVSDAATMFGGITLGAGLLGILLGGWLSGRLARVSGRWLFLVSGLGMLAALPLGLGALLAPDLRVGAALLFSAQTLVFLYMGPLNAIVASVAGAAQRPLAFAANIFIVHAFGDAVSPSLIGAASDAWGLTFALALALAMLAPAAGLCFWGARHYSHDAQTA